MFAVLGEESGLDKKNAWSSLFDVEDPRPKNPKLQGKVLKATQALEVAMFDIQYCDWRARQDVLTIMLLHEKVTLLIGATLLSTFYIDRITNPFVSHY